MKQLPLLVFFVMSYFISWSIWLPLYGSSLGLPALPVLPFHHGIGGLGPMLAAFLTTWFFNGSEGVKFLWQKTITIQPFSLLTIALLGPFVILLIAIIIQVSIYHGSINSTTLLQVKEFPQMNFFAFFVYNLICFGFGEEVGWRGFALPRIQSRYNALVSSFVLTLFWALWHLPLFLYRPGYMQMGIAEIFGWITSLLMGSVLLTSFYNGARGSIFICAIFHTAIDMAFMANVSNENIIETMGKIVAIWGILVVWIYKPYSLSREEKLTD